ncbi:hypothetical protein V6N13_025235 [Hibiscus sabdariffa]
MDCRIWKYERSGVYTVSNGYNFLTRSSCEQHEGLDQHSVNRKKSFYGSLCSLKAPPKVKITFCRFVNNFIPTFANLYSRRLNVEVTCVLCSNTHPHSFILDQEMAKARSCEQTVYLVWDLRFRKLVFEGEALSVISKINSSTDDISGINAILENIYKESSYFHSFSFIHVWRSCNEDAYALALEDGSRFGFIRMKSEREAVRVMERLDGRWIYGSRIRVSWAKSGGRFSFQRRKRVAMEVESVQLNKEVEPLQIDSIASVMDVTQPEFLDLLG